MADEGNPNQVISDTAAVAGNPAVLTPAVIPDLTTGAMTVKIPALLTSILPLWVSGATEVWRQMGLAVAGCGGRLKTAHPTVNFMLNRVGEHLQAVMFHPCARLTRWPEMDVLRVMHNCYVNARDLLNSTLVPDNTERPRATQVGAQAIAFRCWVMPFYGSYVRNEYIAMWARRSMELMTMLMQADENMFSYGFSQQFVNLVAVPLRENYKFMLVNLLKVDPTKVTDTYVATDADFAAYAAALKSTDDNLVGNAGSIDPLWTPSANDRSWCAGAFTYAQLAPLLSVWPETAAPAIPDSTAAATSTTGATSTGGINTTT